MGYKIQITTEDGTHVADQVVSDFALGRVRGNFNPSALSEVSISKILTAACLEHIKEHGKDPRETAVALTTFETASMWAVKSITAGA